MKIDKNIALMVLKAMNPTAAAIADLVNYNKNNKPNSHEIESDVEINESEITLDILKEQISIAQDLAIARRIETAEEVEIEEIYDNSKKGNVGLNGESEGITIGVSGSGRVISKRIYKFKGYNKERTEQYEEAIASVINMKKEINNND